MGQCARCDCAGLTSLATCLTAASGLALLDVSGCGVGAAGAAALGTALTAGAPLTTVCLRGNAIGAAGAAALAAALARTATLEELDAGSNQVSRQAHLQIHHAKCTGKRNLVGNVTTNCSCKHHFLCSFLIAPA